MSASCHGRSATGSPSTAGSAARSRPEDATTAADSVRMGEP